MAKGSVQIVVERCKACGFCVEFCPTHVLALSSAFNAKGYHTPYMADPEKCRQFGAAGRKRVEEKFGWSAIAKQTAELYRSLCEGTQAKKRG